MSSATDFRQSKTTSAVLLTLFIFALSISWTSANIFDALSSLGKYGKLLIIPVILVLIKNRKEALVALAAFAATQLFLLASSSMQYLHIPVPWAISKVAVTQNATFSSYLDQGIMNAVFAGVCWHLRAYIPGRFGRHLAVGAAAIALFNVFFVFQGRSGHAVAILLMSLAIMWELPKRYRISVVLFPVMLLFSISLISPKVKERLARLDNEIQLSSFGEGGSIVSGTSSGIRLHLWHRGLQSIEQSPLAGSGVGSWNSEFNRLEHAQNPKHKDIPPLGNPHQEYLHWGVQLGIPGLFLFVSLMGAVISDSMKMEKNQARVLQSVLVAFAAACLFNSSLYDALIGDFFCVLFGLLLAFGRFRKPQNEARSSNTSSSA